MAEYVCSSLLLIRKLQFFEVVRSCLRVFELVRSCGCECSKWTTSIAQSPATCCPSAPFLLFLPVIYQFFIPFQPLGVIFSSTLFAPIFLDDFLCTRFIFKTNITWNLLLFHLIPKQAAYFTPITPIFWMFSRRFSIFSSAFLLLLLLFMYLVTDLIIDVICSSSSPFSLVAFLVSEVIFQLHLKSLTTGLEFDEVKSHGVESNRCFAPLR